MSDANITASPSRMSLVGLASGITIGDIVSFLIKNGAYIAVIGGMAAFITKPYAEEFIDEHLKNKGFVTQQQLDDIIKNLEGVSNEQQQMKNTIESLNNGSIRDRFILNDLQRSQDTANSNLKIIIDELKK